MTDEMAKWKINVEMAFYWTCDRHVKGLFQFQTF